MGLRIQQKKLELLFKVSVIKRVLRKSIKKSGPTRELRIARLAKLSATFNMMVVKEGIERKAKQLIVKVLQDFNVNFGVFRVKVNRSKF